MTQIASPPDISRTAHVPVRGRSSWVQTERSAHEIWAQLAVRSPRASALLHVMVARMGSGNALVISQKTLALLMGCHERTVRRSISELIEENWIQAIQIGQAGSVNAYVINSAVAWGQRRNEIHTASFTATVVASADEQKGSLNHKDLKKIPLIYNKKTFSEDLQ